MPPTTTELQKWELDGVTVRLLIRDEDLEFVRSSQLTMEAAIRVKIEPSERL